MLARIALTASAVAFATSIFAPAAGQGTTGRYGAVMEHDPTAAPVRTIYRPRDLINAVRLPIIAWGNGACADDGGAGARPFLMELASHGFLIMAPGKPAPDRSSTPLQVSAPAAPPDGPPPGADPTQASELNAAIDWAIQENGRPGSIYRGKLDPAAVAVMGHSCGGLQALLASSDPRVKATMIWNSGVYVRPGGRSGVRIAKADLKALHAPVIYVLGGPTDIAYANGVDDFGQIDHVPAMLMESPVGHGGTFQQPNGGAYATVAISWLNWRLKKDTQAARQFVGPNCGYCNSAVWKITRKGMD